MYDIYSQLIIDRWRMLENTYDVAFMTLYSMYQQDTITISNNNCMKYLHVIRGDNNKQTTQQYTHIHSFVNDMIANCGNDIFSNYEISCENIPNKKRQNKHNYDDEHNQIKRNKCE